MSPADVAVLLQPRAADLQRLANELERRLTNLDRRVAEAVAVAMALTIEVGEAGHLLRNLKTPIGTVLAELDSLMPIGPEPT